MKRHLFSYQKTKKPVLRVHMFSFMKLYKMSFREEMWFKVRILPILLDSCTCGYQMHAHTSEWQQQRFALIIKKAEWQLKSLLVSNNWDTDPAQNHKWNCRSVPFPLMSPDADMHFFLSGVCGILVFSFCSCLSAHEDGVPTFHTPYGQLLQNTTENCSFIKD